MRGIEQYLQVDAATLGALKYQGTWDASTNTPTLTSSVGVQGQYYVVSVAGSTNLNGETNWQVGDWAVFNGSVWQKVDGGSTGLLTTLTVTGNTYLATTSGSVGVGTTSILAGMSLDVDGLAAVGTQTAVPGIGGNIRYRDDTGTQRYAVGILGAPAETGFSFYDVVASTERMRITSAGDVGIGTGSPLSPLHVKGTTNGNLLVRAASSAASGLTGLGLSSINDAASDVADMALQAKNFNFVTDNTVRATLDSSGNLGLGVTPSAWRSNTPAFQIGASGVSLFSDSGVGAGFGNNVFLNSSSQYIYQRTDLASRYQQYQGVHAWYNAPSGTAGNAITFTQAMTLDASGNLGLGVTPSAWSGVGPGILELNGNAYVYSTSGVLSSGANAYFNGSNWIYKTTQAATRYEQVNGTHKWDTAPSGTAGNAISFTQAMTLDASGNVQVGTTTGSSRMTLAVPSAASVAKTVLTLTDETQASVSFILHTDLVRMATGGSDALAFETNGSERMRLDSSGNLGLGVTPSAWNSSYKAFQFGAGSIATVTTGEAAYLHNAFINSGGNYAYVNTAAAARYSQAGGVHYWFTAPSGTAGNAISFTQAMTLDASGNLVVGASSANARIDAVGGSGVRVNEDAANTKIVFLRSDYAGLGPSIQVSTNHPLLLLTNNTERARIPAAGGMVVGTAALATTATDGFLYVPTCAGTPTGTPTTQTGTAPIVVDTTNNKLYFYSGGQWRDAGP